jgi:hypothetical protein
LGIAAAIVGGIWATISIADHASCSQAVCGVSAPRYGGGDKASVFHVSPSQPPRGANQAPTRAGVESG